MAENRVMAPRNRRYARVKMVNSKDTLAGLAQAWERHDVLRRNVLWQGYLLQWPSSEAVGVGSYAAAKMNHDALTALFQKWVAVAPEPRAMSLEAIQPQAPWFMQIKK